MVRFCAEALPIQDRSLDGLICKVALPFTAEPKAFAEMSRVLKKGASGHCVSIGAGYYLPWRNPSQYRGYLWVMGPFLKGAGAR